MPKASHDSTTKTPDFRGFSFALQERGGRLELSALHHPQYGPVFADWLSTEVKRRIAGGKKQLLARALGLNKKTDLRILDATGGLGRDAWTLAALGAQVTLCERNEVVFKLLSDAHRRAAEAAPETAQRLTLIHADARRLMKQDWDAIHLDPMFPHEGKTALPSKELQVLRELCGDDSDAHALLADALPAAARIAVKRPLTAPCLANLKPQLTLKATQMRYDIYLR